GGRVAAGLVRADERDVERVARVCEVVRVAAEEPGLELGREDELDGRVAAVAVEHLLAAVEERDDLALEVGRVLALRDDGLARGVRGGGDARLIRARGHCRPDALRDILDLDELVEEQAGTDELVRSRGRVEALGQVVPLRGGDRLDAVAGAVVVGRDQPVRRDEGGGADLAVADGGEPHLLEPGRGGIEAVALAPVLERRVLERPHGAQLAAGERDAVRDAAGGRGRLERFRGGGDGLPRGRGGRGRRDGDRLLLPGGASGQGEEREGEQRDDWA